MNLTPEDLAAVQAAARAGAAEALADHIEAQEVPADDRAIGPLNEYGAHQIAGDDPAMWFYTLTGWDRATTVLQRANIAKQVGIDADTGELAGTGPGVTGFAEGRIVNATYIPLTRSEGTDSFGNQRWIDVDDRNHWAFRRKRVRARGIDALRAALDAVRGK